LVAAGGGCEIAIGSDVPAYECLSTAPAVCPGNEVCDPHTHQCVTPCSESGCKGGLVCDPGSNQCVAAPTDDGPSIDETSAGDDADATTAPDEAAPPVETGPVEGGCGRGLTCPCSGDSSCNSGICADSAVVPTGLYAAAGNAAFCTKPCCTSADCDPGTVCFAAGGSSSVAGNFCVSPAWVSRGNVLGSLVGGATCSTGRDCRSGLCNGTSCADTCCSTASSGECAGGTSCRFAAFVGAASFDKNYVAWCGQAGNGQNGANCSSNNSCASALCDGIDGCADACRNTADCSQGESCAYVSPASPNTAVVAACFSGAGNASEGSSCSSDQDCKSQFCDTTITQQCTDVCFTNADCTKSGWRCRPEAVTLQSGGKVTVLACGP
ncbi:MAG: hypothetical protein ACRELB_24340, partial [Polyangiaceae bacterium]